MAGWELLAGGILPKAAGRAAPALLRSGAAAPAGRGESTSLAAGFALQDEGLVVPSSVGLAARIKAGSRL